MHENHYGLEYRRQSARPMKPYMHNQSPMHILLALDSFKGCLTSEEVEAAFARALTARGADVSSLPLSDGGEGMLQAFTAALHGQTIEVEVHDPLMRPVTARYGLAPDGTAIIESAQACGLTLIPAAERNPLTATSYGVGELVAHAARRGCRRFIIGLGGCRFVLASDVRNPLYGPEGAAHVFAPQKGATPDMVDELDRRARHFAELSARRMGWDASTLPGAGAAGGLGYAFLQYLQATMESGADLLLDLAGFDHLLKHADLVITGEGHADRQTLMGKLPERVMRRARQQGIPVWLIAGQADDTASLLQAGFSRVSSLTPAGMPLKEAIRPETARKNILRWVERNWNY